MAKLRDNLPRRRWPWAAACLAALLIAGCSSWNWRGENVKDDLSNYNEKLRPAGPKGELDGLSERSNQIERNLGYR